MWSKRIVGSSLFLLVLAMLLVNMKPAWALTITPPSPTAGVPFTINCVNPTCFIIIYTDITQNCLGPNLGTFTSLSNTVTIPGLAAGQYKAFEAAGGPQFCVLFTVVPLVPEYPLGLAVLVVFMVLAYSVIKRRSRN